MVHGHIATKSKIHPLQVCKSIGGCGSAPAMWVDGGIHANEWIGHAVASFIARWGAWRQRQRQKMALYLNVHCNVPFFFRLLC